MSENLTFKSLGLRDYGGVWQSMKSHIREEDFKNEIWFLEHTPVFTLGTAADQKHILNAKGIPVIQSDRGGEVTYHGPGQLVIYFMIDVKRSKLGPKILVKTLQEFTKSLLKEYSIDSEFIDGAPGVYVNEKKIASIGLRISKGKTYHGISINVDMDLAPFSYINPCGYEGLKVTQIKDLKNKANIKDVERLAIKLLEPIF
ncbi:lipoyl(octanoyl) transferase LipB [Gammaproteobacteria bacterium]|nr:lipoyl(octanoyl) transferase LipB [Gammaproteobacteria bacterium]MDC0467121.1 lipoyl(octanoyl) transferase LipB [Gammaproteobacteria bacterium]MDC3217025.1 lipoyl(octanoyl) transferase LipB [Gammaproteobacteria bacterium]MDC3225178.1 lipoyl(octanoyl) transferase LipB [Gammaproteobacteria bacterium]MDC3268534.1 lipoyl(octanoyl) transferase LipB [Gammaproteobacteria bacterium]